MHAALVRAVVVTFCAFFSIAALAAAPAVARAAPDQHPAAAVTAVTHAAAAVAAVTRYKVRPGDSLSVIARRAWHHAAWWPRLWYANRAKIRNPDVIRAGQVLRLPYGKQPRASTVRGALRAIPKPPPPAPVAAPRRHRHYHAAAAPAPAASYTGGSGFQACVIRAESGGNPRAVNPSSGAGGLYQFLPSTWAGLGYAAAYPGGAQTAPVSVQNAAFWKLYGEAGTSPWAPYDGC